MPDVHVYWAARDLDGPPVGNHHFVLITFDESVAFPPIPTQMEKGQRFITLAAVKSADGKGNLVFAANQRADVTSVREFINPDEHVSWYKADFDMEQHEVTPVGNALTFAQRLVQLAQVFDRNSKTSPIPYSLRDENCAAFVNTLLKLAGVPATQRLDLGEFSGVDWGEEDTVPDRLFR